MTIVRNPILPGCHPDPSVCRDGDAVLLVTSTFEYLPALPIHRSTDLVHWELVGHAIHRPEQLDLRGLDGSSGLYAPTIRRVGDRLVVVCTVVGPDDGSWSGRTGHLLVTAQDAAGPWSDPIWIDGVGGFDPSITVDGDRVWLCGTRVAEPARWRGDTEVWIAPLDLETGALLQEPVVIWRGAAVGAVWAEGPHVLPHPDGGWMLVVAEGGTDLDHAVCVATAPGITGPYTGDPGNPRLTHRDLGERAAITAVGHADLVGTVDGATWAVALATHPVDGRRGLLGRRTSLVPVEWEHGRVLFAPGTGRVTATVDVPGEVSGDGEPHGSPRSIVDEFAGGPLALDWTGVGRHPSSFVDLTARPGAARIEAGDDPTSTGDISMLGRRLPSERTLVEAAIELVPRDDALALRAGILLRVSERDQLELSIDRAGDAVLRIVSGGEGVELGRVGFGDGHRWWRLRLRINDLSAVASVAAVTGSPLDSGSIESAPVELAPVDVGALAPTPPRGFLGAWIGVFAAGSGAVDLERFAMAWDREGD
jgi:alpha-N-arabinofuranosidase